MVIFNIAIYEAFFFFFFKSEDTCEWSASTRGTIESGIVSGNLSLYRI